MLKPLRSSSITSSNEMAGPIIGDCTSATFILDKYAALDVHGCADGEIEGGGLPRNGHDRELDGIGCVAEIVDVSEAGIPYTLIVKSQQDSAQYPKALAMSARQWKAGIFFPIGGIKDMLGAPLAGVAEGGDHWLDAGAPARRVQSHIRGQRSQ